MTDAALGGVLVTRPQSQSAELAAAVEAAGGEAVLFPAIDIIGRETTEIEAELRQLPPVDIAVFVSRNAVANGFPALRDSNARIAAVGPATRNAIEALGGSVHIVPEHGFDSEHLLRHAALKNVRNLHVLIVRGQSGRELLADTLRERGATVNYLCVYERRRHQPSLEEGELLVERLQAGKIRFVVVMSVDSLKCLLESVPPECLDALRQVTLVAPGARVLQTACELIPGIQTELAGGPQAQDIVATLVSLAQSDMVS
ncbi:MAG: uroporphyrinogen-III synthase [Woeseiaceae bacterium]|nr:uroporphyrinogen-III synthase [Woeseiaceae bacterium]